MLCNGTSTGTWAWDSVLAPRWAYAVRLPATSWSCYDLCVRDIGVLQMCDVVVVMVRKPLALLSLGIPIKPSIHAKNILSI